MSQKYADIIIDISHEAIDRSFQYIIPEALVEEVSIGMKVQVPFGNSNRTRTGYVIGISDEPNFDVDKLKEIVGIPNKSLMIEGKLIKLAEWMHKTYGSTMINALKTVMPVKEQIRKTRAKVVEEEYEIPDLPVEVLNDEQQGIVDCYDYDINAGKSEIYLLHGITGSGKTEVYIECIKKTVAMGRQAIVLIPEIGLTYQTVARFKMHFGERVAIINSKQSKGEKYREFMRAKNHEADVVIGPRSALFAPCDNLGLIVIDEEHDGAYKSDQAPKYHARETAIELARLSNAAVILGSATPTLESYQMAKTGRYKLFELLERPDGRSMPEVSVVDMREELRHGNRSIISDALYRGIKDRLDKKEQIILFINRRGLNNFISCRECGKAIMCPKCDVTLSLHDNKKMMCHYCGYTMQQPVSCPSCSSRMIGGIGTGTQKVESEIKRIFPHASCVRMDRDTTANKGAMAKILSSFNNREADILIGTQMIVKGHDFAGVTLVGIVLADVSLLANDYRTGERTFDLLTQAAGRAGRGSIPGEVIIQTYQPDNYAIMSAANQDYQGFFDMEMTYRRIMKYPPVYNMMVILMVSDDYDKVKDASDVLSGVILKQSKDKNGVRIIGPCDATIARINDIYRRVIYIKSMDMNELTGIMKIVEDYDNEHVSILVDVNPVNMY